MIDVVCYWDGLMWIMFICTLILVWWVGLIIGYYTACKDLTEGRL